MFLNVRGGNLLGNTSCKSAKLALQSQGMFSQVIGSFILKDGLLAAAALRKIVSSSLL